MQRFGGKFKFIHGFQNLQFLHGFQQRLLLHSSTNSTNLFDNYLVTFLGFSHEKALSISTKLAKQGRNVNDVNTSSNANSVVCFLKTQGFDETLIRKIVSSNPRLLYSKVDKTLKPKFDFLKNEGFSKDDVIRLISGNSNVLVMGLDSSIAPAVKLFREVMICDSHVISVLKNFKSWSFGGIVHHLLPNVTLLGSFGISTDVIRKHLIHKSSTFFRKPETFRGLVNRVEEKLGISRESPMFMYGIHLASSLSEESLESKCGVFKSFGWTQSDVEMLMMRNSKCFTLSDENIKKKLGFLMNELRLEPACLVSRCSLLTCSLEKRLVPRHDVLQILKSNGLLKKCPNFPSAVNMNESRFLNKYVLPFQEVHQVYANHIGCSVSDFRFADPKI